MDTKSCLIVFLTCNMHHCRYTGYNLLLKVLLQRQPYYFTKNLQTYTTKIC